MRNREFVEKFRELSDIEEVRIFFLFHPISPTFAYCDDKNIRESQNF